MFFLMNDVVLNVVGAELAPVTTKQRFGVLDFNSVKLLGQELFAENPLLQIDKPERAKRLAALIMLKAPEINAALFVAPEFGCRPQDVVMRHAHIEIELMAELHARQRVGRLDAVAVDRSVWRRLAA